MKATRGSLATLLRITVVLITLWGVDKILGGFRMAQMETLKRDIEATKLKTADERNAAKVLKAEGAELQERLAEARGDIIMLQKKMDSASEKRKDGSMPEVPLATQGRRRDITVSEGTPPRGFWMNQVINNEPFCTKRPKRKSLLKGKLPQFVFVAGVEGSGHHALKDVWWALEESGTKMKLVVYDQLFHSLGIENHASFHYSSIRKESYISAMKPLFEEAAMDGAFVVDAQNSYPMGKGAGVLAHPDLIMLEELDGVLFDLKVIVLFRDPVNATLSAVRRFQNNEEYLYKNHGFQARMVSENLATINNAIPRMPCGKTLAIKYEDLTTHPERLAGAMSSLLGVNKGVINKAFAKLHPHQAKPDSPKKAADRRLLKIFFDLQKVMWPLLESPSLR